MAASAAAIIALSASSRRGDCSPDYNLAPTKLTFPKEGGPFECACPTTRGEDLGWEVMGYGMLGTLALLVAALVVGFYVRPLVGWLLVAVIAMLCASQTISRWALHRYRPHDRTDHFRDQFHEYRVARDKEVTDFRDRRLATAIAEEFQSRGLREV